MKLEGTVNWDAKNLFCIPPLAQEETTRSKCAPSLFQQHRRTFYLLWAVLNVHICPLWYNISLLSSGLTQNPSKILPQNMPEHRNMFNDRARRNFCYWLAEKKPLQCRCRFKGWMIINKVIFSNYIYPLWNIYDLSSLIITPNHTVTIWIQTVVHCISFNSIL